MRDPRQVCVPADLWDRPEVERALRARDLGVVIRVVRKYTGLSQSEVGQLLGVGQPEISHIERGKRRVADLDMFERVADGLVMPDQARMLLGLAPAATRPGEETTPRATVPRPRSEPSPVLKGLRAAVVSYRPPRPAADAQPLADVEAQTVEVHRRYQQADYDGAGRLLPGTLSQADAIAVETSGRQQHRALRVQAAAYLAAAKLARKAGDVDLAWVTADRAARSAALAESAPLSAAAAYQVACAFASASPGLSDADQVARAAADDIGRTRGADDPELISAQGSLLLIAAVIAARQNRGREAQKMLDEAATLADRVGDQNYLWTAFGPTNVAIHRVSVAVALSRPDQAIRIGERIEVSAMPEGLIGRRTQVHLEFGWAYAQQQQDALAVLHLLEAERIAPQTVRVSATARRLLATLLDREHRALTPGLRPLARRAGVIS